MTVKTINGIATASIKTAMGVAVASIKTWGAESYAASDPNWASVVLLAGNDNKADATTAFDDQSASNHTLTAVAQVQYDTAQAPTGMTSSILFDGSGDRIDAANHANWQFSSGDWTVEIPIRFVSTASDRTIYNFGYQNNVARSLVIYYSATGPSLHVAQSTDGTANSDVARTWSPSIDTWYWLQVRRSGASVQIAIDGTQVGADISAVTLYASAETLQLAGTSSAAGNTWNGWFGPLRVTKGVARAFGAMPSLPLPID